MGKHHLRQDMTCLNCRHVVEKRFCPNCGQENSDSRKTFHHLFVHFFEDLTHYENAFWKTIRNLLVRPGALTTEYLSGRRLSYLAPVRLYIFISFLTFFLISVLPTDENPDNENHSNKPKFDITYADGESRSDSTEIKKLRDSLSNSILASSDSLKINDFGKGKLGGLSEYSSVRSLDSVQRSLPKAKRLTGWNLWYRSKLAKINELTGRDDFKEKFGEGMVHNMPKALFLYMPFFALALWLFHNKKRWFYFDHGIFTLHYFSFILLTYSIYLIVKSIAFSLGEWAGDLVQLLLFLEMIWWFFYFFRSHRRFYGESKLISRLKSFALFFINLFFMLVFMVLLLLYTILNLH